MAHADAKYKKKNRVRRSRKKRSKKRKWKEEENREKQKKKKSPEEKYHISSIIKTTYWFAFNQPAPASTHPTAC